MEVKSGKITAIVEDDGHGFDVKAVFKSRIGTQSLGLLGIEERAALLGGTFKIKSRVGQGTRLVVEIPITVRSENPAWSKQGNIETGGLNSGKIYGRNEQDESIDS